MFHLALYSSSIGPGATLAQVNAVPDTVIPPSGNGFLVGLLNNIMRVSAVCTNLTRAQLDSASIRKYAKFDIGPVNIGAAIESPPRMADFSDQPIPLAVNEELDANAVQSNAAAQRATVAVWFCDGAVRPMKGRYFSVHWTNATALVANAWTGFTPTLDNGIPSGTFSIVGLRAISAGALFARIIPRGGSVYRPGTFAFQAQDAFDIQNDRYGNIGEYIRFTNTTLPQVEMFSGSADATQEGYFDLIQVG